MSGCFACATFNSGIRFLLPLLASLTSGAESPQSVQQLLSKADTLFKMGVGKKQNLPTIQFWPRKKMCTPPMPVKPYSRPCGARLS
jgi:hypothetical protein